ncbi:MAG: NYN domain-containing protein [Selenomonadaceae bacterium]|nr:NYN domain-containing protein [Selenomonadaceae bacterium]
MMKVAVFLDYANINASSRQLSCDVDYGALLNYLADESEDRTLQAAYAYVPIDPRQEHAMDSVISELWRNGYIVKSKVGTIAGDSYKCDFDVEMTLDISRIAYGSIPDIIVLVSGDSDFIPIVLDMRGRGIRVEVAAFDFSMSRQLALKSSGFIKLDSIVSSESVAEYLEPLEESNTLEDDERESEDESAQDND